MEYSNVHIYSIFEKDDVEYARKPHELVDKYSLTSILKLGLTYFVALFCTGFGVFSYAGKPNRHVVCR